MCGIAAILHHGDAEAGSGTDGGHVLDTLMPWLCARGPDCQGTVDRVVRDADGTTITTLTMAATLLHIRGIAPDAVPLQDHGTVLCYNGECFGGMHVAPIDITSSMQAAANDGMSLFHALQGVSGDCIVDIMSAWRGPWSLLFWQQEQQRLWFGRDVLGRRSLLLRTTHRSLCFSSIAPPPAHHDKNDTHASTTSLNNHATHRDDDAHDALGADSTQSGGSAWMEVPPGIYCIDMHSHADADTHGAGKGPPLAQQGPLIDALHNWGLATPCIGPAATPTAATAATTDTAATVATATPAASTHVPATTNAPTTNAPTSAATNAPTSAATNAPITTAATSSDRGRLLCWPWSCAVPQALATMQRIAPDTLAPPVATDTQATQVPPPQSPQISPTQTTQTTVVDKQAGTHNHTQQQHQQADHHNVTDNHNVSTHTIALDLLRHAVALRCCAATTSMRPVRCIQEPSTFAATRGPSHYAAPGGPVSSDLCEMPCDNNTYDNNTNDNAIHTSDTCTNSIDTPTTTSNTTTNTTNTSSTHLKGMRSDRTVSMLLPVAPVMVMFSGGVDSTLLAALTHDALPPGVPIDLVSICFDHGQSPDRTAALDALKELRGYAPERTWRLLLVNATLEDVDAHRAHLLQLLHPAHTIMDFNIGAALWLAARGVGHLHDDDIIGGDIIDDTMMGPKDTTDSACASPPPLQPSSTPLQPSSPPHPLYQSAARVVLMGHGADELCGGYGRHRSQFRVRGWQGLQEELQLDMQRLWVRNLGRDDRLVSDHGREARHPFLDEAFVQHVLQLPLWQVADLRQGPGQGDKVLLRNMLGTLGLPRAAGRVKRAIQFGTRLGIQCNRRDFGSNRAANQRNAGSLRIGDVIDTS